MRTMAFAIIIPAAALAWNTAKADFTCSENSNVCSHSVQTSAPAVGPGGGGHTADKREWVIAPGDKYFVNPTTSPQGFTGRNVACEIGGSDGVQQRRVSVGGGGVTVTFAKKYLVVAHAETGSGLQNIGRTAMMVCTFNAEVASLPN